MEISSTKVHNNEVIKQYLPRNQARKSGGAREQDNTRKALQNQVPLLEYSHHTAIILPDEGHS